MDIRYFVEVTPEEAQAMEKAGTASIVQGASGQSDHPHWYGPSVAWGLMRTLAADVEYRKVVYPEG